MQNLHHRRYFIGSEAASYSLLLFVHWPKPENGWERKASCRVLQSLHVCFQVFEDESVYVFFNIFQ